MKSYKKVLIDPEFRALIFPLNEEERATLENSLIRDGCLAPLVVWAEQGALLDGHHRKELCDRHGIDYQVCHVSLPDRNAAKRWIIQHQFGRRNLTPYQRAELILKLKPLLAAEALEREHAGRGPDGSGGRGRKRNPQSNLIEGFSQRADWTQHKLAQLARLSTGTISKAEFISQRADEETKERLRRGESTVHAEYIRLKREEKDRQREASRNANAQRVRQGQSLDDLIAAGTRFATIVIDPPWDWGDEGDCDQLGRARPAYATIPFERLLELPVDRLADGDSHLYLWITNRSLAIRGSVFIASPYAIIEGPDGKPAKEYSIDRRPVVIGKSRVLRCRPKWDRWQMHLSLEIDTAILSPRQVAESLALAGRIIGIGDYRPEKSGGFGRFAATLLTE